MRFDGDEMRSRDLALFVKHWGKARGLVDAKNGFLSSYAWANIVIFFLQRRGLLPALQSEALVSACERFTGHEVASGALEGHAVRFADNEPFLRALRASRDAAGLLSRESTASLLCAFFLWLRNFPIKAHAVSIRLGAPRDRRARVRWTHSRGGKCLGVEDPFEGGRNLGVTWTALGWDAFRAEIDRAVRILHNATNGHEAVDELLRSKRE
jgi:DNA polymerase sigma